MDDIENLAGGFFAVHIAVRLVPDSNPPRPGTKGIRKVVVPLHVKAVLRKQKS